MRVTVVENERAEFDSLLALLRLRGGVLVNGFAPAPGVVCTGVVEDEEDAAAAVLAVLRGASLVVYAAANRTVVDRMLDDLRRLASVDHRVGSSPIAALAPEEMALLNHLYDGLTLGEAAGRLAISRRTADRRLASARRAMGAGTTAEALVGLSRCLEQGPVDRPGRRPDGWSPPPA